MGVGLGVYAGICHSAVGEEPIPDPDLMLPSSLRCPLPRSGKYSHDP